MNAHERERALTHAEVVERARKLVPALRQRAERAEADRRVPRESIEEIVGAGLARVLQPKRFGGLELGHTAAFDVAVEIGSGCGSTGWITGLLNIHDWWLATFEEEAQHDVWRDSPDQNIAAMVYPTGKAKPVDGGFRLSGRWGWVSGVDHSHWVIIAGLVVPDDGPPHALYFLLPRADYKIVDTWRNVGLRGTGSNDVIVDDVFVPAHRTLSTDDSRDGITPGGKLYGSRTYNVPMITTSPHALAAPALGIARAAWNDWLQWTSSRTTIGSGESVAEHATTQIRLAEVEAEIDAAELLIRRNLAVLEGDVEIDMALRARSYAGYAFAIQSLKHAVEALVSASGARGMIETNALQRYWRDIHAAAAHTAFSLELSGQLRGRALLGLPRDPRVRMY